MAEEAKGMSRFWIWVGVAVAIGALIGVGATAAFMSPAAPAPASKKTFTIVAYHWGFAIYDEAGNEVPKIEVAKGTEVTLLVIGAEALSHEIHEIYEDRTIEAWADNPDFGGLNATEIKDKIEEAEAQGLEDHSVLITGYGIQAMAKADSPSPTVVTFIADKEGAFNIQCNEFCGWGHQYMILEGGFAVS